MANILLVEGDNLLRQTLENVLRQSGHTVTSADAPSQTFDLTLCEVDEVELLQPIRKLQPHLRSILMAGYSSLDAPLRAAPAQADDYLLKPFTGQALVRSVERVLCPPSQSTSLLTRLGAVPGQAARRALSWFYHVHWQQLEELRQQGLGEFLLQIHSKRLKAAEALAYFSAWEEIELDYLKNGSPQCWAQILVDYHRWHKGLLQRKVPNSVSDTISLAAFELLYLRIQSGLLELSHLLRAIELLHVPEARQHNLHDFCTYHWVWGQGFEQGDPFLGLSIKGYRLVRLHSPGDSPTRLYEAVAEYQPQPGERILCLPATQEWSPLLNRELASDKAKLLSTFHEHHFLLYSGHAMSLGARLPGNGISPYQAWKLLRPVFLQVGAYHGRGQVSGCFSLRDIDWPPQQECNLSHFSLAGYGEAYAQLQKADGHPAEFFSAPEVVCQPQPTPASDQAVLGRLLFEVVYGGRYPDHSLRGHLRALGKPESTQAFAPYLERLGALGPLFCRLAHSDPQQRFADLNSAIAALDAAFEGDRC